MKKLTVLVVVCLLLAGGWLIGKRVQETLQADPDGQRRGAPAVPVEIAPVQRADLRDKGVFSGSLYAESRFVVAPRVPGTLKSLAVHIGDAVHPGQLIAELDDQEYVQAAERAKAELAVAKASAQECGSNLDNTRREFDRTQALRDKKIASESEYDQAKAQWQVQQARCEVAQAQVDQSEAALKGARIQLGYTKIHADWTGGAPTRYIGERFVDQGALLTANAPIVSVIDISKLTAAVYVIERDYLKISVGQKAVLTTEAFAGKAFSGQVLRIAPQLQQTSRQARVEIGIVNDTGLLKPGMFVTVVLEFACHKDAQAIPAAALVRRDDKQGVFVVDMPAGPARAAQPAAGQGKPAGPTGKARFIPVTVGIRDGEMVEVTSPVLHGPLVVLGQHLLEDGSGVLIAQSDKPLGAGADGPATSPAVAKERP